MHKQLSLPGREIIRSAAQMFPLDAGRYVGRARTFDMMTFDSRGGEAINDRGDLRGMTLGGQFKTFDSAMNDGEGGYRTYDSTGAFLVGELERLDQTLNEPLVSIMWSRDMQLREDVSIADEVSSYTLSTFAAQGGLGTGNGIGNGKAWVGKNTTEITGISLDIAKIPHPLRLWATEVKFTIPELESAAKAGRPIDAQKYEGMQMKHQMDTDEQVYLGDTTTGDTGLVNAANVTNVSNLPAGASLSAAWSTKTPDEILADFNTALNSVWSAAAWAVTPGKVLLPPAQFGYITNQKVSQAGNVSILKYVQENNLVTAQTSQKLDIQPTKWGIGTGVGGTPGTAGVDRMTVYTNNKKYVRFPMTMLARTPIQYQGLYHSTVYYCRLGVVEVVYPDTVGYFDGL